jgi:hypothetical protein
VARCASTILPVRRLRRPRRALGRTRPCRHRPHARRQPRRGRDRRPLPRPDRRLQTPRSIDFHDEPLPKSGAGKVLKRAPRALLGRPRKPGLLRLSSLGDALAPGVTADLQRHPSAMPAAHRARPDAPRRGVRSEVSVVTPRSPPPLADSVPSIVTSTRRILATVSAASASRARSDRAPVSRSRRPPHVRRRSTASPRSRIRPAVDSRPQYSAPRNSPGGTALRAIISCVATNGSSSTRAQNLVW